MLSHRLLSLSFLIALSLGAFPAAGQTPVFLLDTDEVTFATIFRVAPATGQLVPVGPLPADQGAIASLAAANEDLLYAVTQGGQVLEITVSPFGWTSLGSIGANSIVGLAYSDGRLYALDEGSNSLYRISLAPLSVTLVGAVRFLDGTPLRLGGGDLVADRNGLWYLWTNFTQALYSLNVNNAVVAPVPAQQIALGFTTGLAVDYEAGGALLGSSRDFDALQTLDPASGLPLSSVAFCLACPIPYDHTFGDLASPQFTCPRTKGFWSRNPGAWPVTSLRLGTQTYGQARLLTILAMRINADASLNLAHQLISAKLNLAAGSNPTRIVQTIANADALLGTFPGLLPYNVAPSSTIGRAMITLSRVLETYNNGSVTPGCAP